MKLPAIQIEWDYFKTIDEAHVDDLSEFGIILLTVVKDDDVMLFAYEIDTKTWGLLQQ